MVRTTLFYNPKNKEYRQIRELLVEKSITFILQDATSKQVSMYLYQDMRIDTLPALYLYHNNRYRLYQGCDKIISALSKL